MATRIDKIFLIKLIHSVIFIFMSACLIYILYCAAARRYDWTLVIALAAIIIEGIVLLVNRWRCPLTTLAEKLGAAHGAVTDIFLPLWLARHTFSDIRYYLGIGNHLAGSRLLFLAVASGLSARRQKML